MTRVHHVDQARRVADAVGEHLEGQRLASHLLARIRTEFVEHDELHRLIVQAHQASPDRLRGLARRIQKELEREVAADAR